VADNSNGLRVRSFFDIEAEVLHRRFRIVETLLPAEDRVGAAHTGEEGRHIESILRDFLNRHLPSELRALSGFILRPSTKVGNHDLSRVTSPDQHSSQLDIIVYDRARYPIYEQFEEFAVVPPEGVIGIISVKKSMYRSQLRKELESLRSAAELCDLRNDARLPYLCLFAFTAGITEKRSTEEWGTEIVEAISETMEGSPFSHLVNEVTIFDQLVVFKWAPHHSPPGTARFVRCECGHSARHLPIERILQSLMSVYYARLGIPRPGFVSFEKGSFGDASILRDVPCQHDR